MRPPSAQAGWDTRGRTDRRKPGRDRVNDGSLFLQRPRRFLLCAGVFPRQRHRLAQRLFIHRIETNTCAPGSPPRARLRRERGGIRAHERDLLVGRQLDHAGLQVAVERGEDAPVGPEIRMPHVLFFNRPAEPERDAPKILRLHRCRVVSGCSPDVQCPPSGGPSRQHDRSIARDHDRMLVMRRPAAIARPRGPAITVLTDARRPGADNRLDGQHQPVGKDITLPRIELIRYRW